MIVTLLHYLLSIHGEAVVHGGGPGESKQLVISSTLLYYLHVPVSEIGASEAQIHGFD